MFGKILKKPALEIEALSAVNDVENESTTASEQPQEEWVWVTGYKGTDSNMKCNGFQYEIGTPFSTDEAVLCECGFHLCLKLEDVFKYYKLDFNNRYFRVRALVEKSMADRYGEPGYLYSKNGYALSPPAFEPLDKLVSKEIIFESEVSKEELLEHYKKKFEWIDSQDELDLLSSNDEYISFAIQKATRQLSGKYSDAYLTVMFDDKVAPQKLLVQYMNALCEEGVSADMRAYLIYQYKTFKKEKPFSFVC